MTNNIDVVEQIYKDMTASYAGGAAPLVEEGGTSLLSHLQTGWTTDQASQRREIDGSFNVVRPPVDCPNWLCIILPCINHLDSMKAFKSIQPDDAEVLRNSKWIRYDAASLVTGDVIRLEEGDLIPADCVVVLRKDDGNNSNDDEGLLVDLATVTGQERPTVVPGRSSESRHQFQLYLGGRVVQGQATALVTAIGSKTLLATLIREKRFPPKELIMEVTSSMDQRPGATGIQLRNIS